MENYYLGCDVSKGYCNFSLFNKNHMQVLKSFQLDDTPKGHNMLLKKLQNFIKGKRYTIYAGLESTGGYENHWYNAIYSFSTALNIKIARINPVLIFKSDKVNLGFTKNDDISSQSIAKYLIRYEDKVNYEIEDLWSDLRKQWAFISLLTKQRSQLLNHLESLMYKYNPGLNKYLKKGASNWILQLLIKYPTCKRIKFAKKSGLTKIPHITQKRVLELKKTVNANYIEAPTAIELIIPCICQQIILKQEAKKIQLSHLKKLLPQNQFDVLMSFKGIDTTSAIGLLTHIGDISRFNSKSQFASYFGVYPVKKSSGDKTSSAHFTKKGNSEFKRMLYMVALAAMLHNNDIRYFYLRKKIAGKHSMVALGACMTKVLRILYHLLKKEEPFQAQINDEELLKLENIHEELLKSKKDIQAKEKYNKYRSLNSFDPTAPISKMEQQLRKSYLRENNKN